MFIATANVAETIPGPLLDRMEVIRFDGYTVAEKVAIAPRLPVAAPARAQRPARGRGRRSPTSILRTVVSEYTREAGVRNLERELGTLLRKTATQDRVGEGRGAGRPSTSTLVRDALGRQKVFQEAAARTAVPGVATGLAVTGTGGDVLFVEATAIEAARAPR